MRLSKPNPSLFGNMQSESREAAGNGQGWACREGMLHINRRGGSGRSSDLRIKYPGRSSLSMMVSVVQVRKVRMRMDLFSMAVRVYMRLHAIPVKVMLVLMVNIVEMRMRVIER